jgi:hypothetical protein
MRLSLIQPLPAVELAMDKPDDLAFLNDLYRPMRPDWLRINLIQSLNGAIVGVDGTSNSLSNRIDRKILGIIRSHAEVILVGAKTVRAEGHVLPLGRDLAVVTNSGDLSGHGGRAGSTAQHRRCAGDPPDDDLGSTKPRLPLHPL